MAPIGQFVQLLSALSEMQARRGQLDMNQRELDLRERQFQEFVKTGHTKDVADALQTIMKLAPDARDAFLKMQTEFSPQELAGFHSIVTGQPVDPAVIGATAANRGYYGADPAQQAFMNSQAASRATSGMDLGAAQQSGAQAFGLGGQAPPGLIAAMSQGQPQGYAQQMQGQFAQGAMQMMATRQTPMQAAVDQSAMGQGLVPGFAQSQFGTMPTQYGRLTAPQAAQTDVGRGQVAAQFAQVNERAQADAADNGMKYLQIMASGKAFGQLTPQQEFETKSAIAKLWDDVQSPKATKDANLQRIRLINSYAASLPYPLNQMLTVDDPDKASAKAGMWAQYLNTMNTGRNIPPINSAFPVPPPGQVPPPQPQQQAPGFLPSIPGFSPMQQPNFNQMQPPIYSSPLQPFLPR